MAFRKVSTDNMACSPCSRLGVNNDAAHWCKNCTEYICKECFDFHKKIKQLSDHEFAKVEDVTIDYLHVKDIPQEVFCCLHTDEIATGICISDRKAYCFDCLKSMDVSLNEVLKIENLVKNLDYTMLERDVSCLHKISDILKNSLQCIKHNETDFNKSVQDKLQTVQQLASEAKTFIDELVMQTNTYFKKLSDKEKEQSVKQKQELVSLIDFLELRIMLLKTNKLTSKEILALSLKTKHEMCTNSENLRNILEQSEWYDVKFEPCRIFQQIKNLSSLGEIQKQPKPSTALEKFKQIDDQINLLHLGLFPGPCAQVEVFHIKETDTQLAKTVKDTQDTNVTVSDQRTEMVTSLKKVIKCADINATLLCDGAYLPDGRLLMTDKERDKLLLFDESVTLQAQYDVKRCPSGVCVSADGSLIYVVHDDGTFVTYRLQDRLLKMLVRGLREVSHVKVQAGTTGVGVSVNTIITGHKDNITLYNMEGKKLSSISKEGFGTYICVSQDGSKFYHKVNDQIVCRSVSDLSEIFRYSYPGIFSSGGIACDRHGNILVAGHSSNNIIMIDKDGTHDRVLVDKLHGINGPTGVCCHPQRDEFVVFTYDWIVFNVNVMVVYEMK